MLTNWFAGIYYFMACSILFHFLENGTGIFVLDASATRYLFK